MAAGIVDRTPKTAMTKAQGREVDCPQAALLTKKGVEEQEELPRSCVTDPKR